ncbi:DUF6232 family protein [Acidovorax sp. SUPP2522]|uniref:DUF6232 family protein n=2 Tax=unclassified Acidovorax TaxID=2684926 RepID=UPI0023DE1FB1|nr:DUF6232 family protein [Acidovorax sp. SUPP2522]GKT20030.1 DUF6232 family protein [Acidovorax sp. SUPP2522]
MEEQVFFEHGGVKVTNARFVVDAQTFAMSNVTSINPVTERPSRFALIAFLIIGVLIAFASPVFGIILALICAIFLYLQKTKYHVMLRTAGGETKALTTDEREYFNQVVGAALLHKSRC